MSSTTAPHSPPETPLKRGMAVGNENLNPNRLQDGSSRSDVKGHTLETLSEGIDITNPGSEVQVPSTLPRDEFEVGPVNAPKPLHSDYQGHQADEIRSDAQKEVSEHHSQVKGAQNSNSDKPITIGWPDFENRYKVAIKKANEEEDNLLQEFEKYVDVSLSAYFCILRLTCSEGFFGLGYSLSST
jgi:hypothetical protein